jgi:hypothetical protein
MADVPISNLTDATTVNGTDEIPIVQSGVTKRATITELSAAITPANASTSAKGIIEIATQAEVDTGSSSLLAIVPSTLAATTLIKRSSGIQFFTASGTYTPTTGTRACMVFVQGGGGGGGNGSANNDGVTGSASSFGSYCSANGGAGGVRSTTIGAGGAGGTASNGIANLTGASGSDGYNVSGSSVTFGGLGGAARLLGGAGVGGTGTEAGGAGIANSGSGGGGASQATSGAGGGGGAGGLAIDYVDLTGVANVAVTVGAGGAGGGTGGAGGSGFVLVLEF